jgi:hypothetical protein
VYFTKTIEKKGLFYCNTIFTLNLGTLNTRKLRFFLTNSRKFFLNALTPEHTVVCRIAAPVAAEFHSSARLLGALPHHRRQILHVFAQNMPREPELHKAGKIRRRK